jgi:quercetin dioxygenase-like cupin family protein
MTSIQIERAAQAVTEQEYGCSFRRILPWQSRGPSSTGMGVSVVAPGSVTEMHSHEDYEHFYVVRGNGYFVVDGQRTVIGPGDALVVASMQEHRMENSSATEVLEVLSVWSLGAFGSVE